MALPKNKKEALLQIRLMWMAFLVSILLYMYIGESMLPFHMLSFSHSGITLGAASAADLLSFLVYRTRRYAPAVDLVYGKPGDLRIVRRWTVQWTILAAIAESEALVGFIFRLGHKSFYQASPFYLISLLLMLSLWPKQPWPSAETGPQIQD